jgi:hypothetical protein
MKQTLPFTQALAALSQAGPPGHSFGAKADDIFLHSPFSDR